MIYIPGNHDDFFRQFDGYKFGGIEITNQTIYISSKGKKYIVTHGDEFDAVVKYHRWLALIGDNAYSVILWINKWLNVIRKYFGYQYWSFSSYLKQKVKDAVNYISDFEKLVVLEAKHLEVDGIICGHIHRPNIMMIEGILYCNDGDWVDSCSALVETLEGELMILFDSREKKTLTEN